MLSLLSRVATSVFNVRLLHVVVFSKLITLIASNQINFYTTACIEYTLNTSVAMSLYKAQWFSTFLVHGTLWD